MCTRPQYKNKATGVMRILHCHVVSHQIKTVYSFFCLFETRLQCIISTYCYLLQVISRNKFIKALSFLSLPSKQQAKNQQNSMIRATCTGSDVIGADAVVAPEEVVRVPLPLGVQQAVVVAGVPPKLNLPILHVFRRLVKVAALPESGQYVSHLQHVETQLSLQSDRLHLETQLSGQLSM